MEDPEDDESLLLVSELQSCAVLDTLRGTLFLPGEGEQFPHFICKKRKAVTEAVAEAMTGLHQQLS